MRLSLQDWETIMKCNKSLIMLSGCLLSASLCAEDKAVLPPDPKAPSSRASYVIDLYVDTKTKQIYSEPGEGRVRMGSFEKVADVPGKTAPTSDAIAPADSPAAATEVATAIKPGKSQRRLLQTPKEWATRTGNLLIHLNGT